MRVQLLRPMLALVVCLMVLPAFAQPPGGGRGGFGGRGGPGGFPGRGGGGSLARLLMAPQVREELNLREDQQQALEKVAEQMRSGGDRERFDFRNASDEERREFIAQRQRQAEELEKKLDEQLNQLLGPDQLDRLKEINVQLQGPRALMDDEVAQKLELTAAQRSELRQITEKLRDEMRAMFQEGGFRGGREEGDGGNFREKIGEMTQKAEEQMVAVLNDEQKKKFDELKGAPFEMERRRGGFRGRGGDREGGFRGRGGERGGSRGRGEGRRGGR